eukprot:1856575-Pleurochrysis_carterae.AAC.4
MCRRDPPKVRLSRCKQMQADKDPENADQIGAVDSCSRKAVLTDEHRHPVGIWGGQPPSLSRVRLRLPTASTRRLKTVPPAPTAACCACRRRRRWRRRRARA